MIHTDYKLYRNIYEPIKESVFDFLDYRKKINMFDYNRKVRNYFNLMENIFFYTWQSLDFLILEYQTDLIHYKIIYDENNNYKLIFNSYPKNKKNKNKKKYKKNKFWLIY